MNETTKEAELPVSEQSILTPEQIAELSLAFARDRKEENRYRMSQRFEELRESHEALRAELAAMTQRAEAAEKRLNGEYICKCGLRVTPHCCRNTEGSF